MRKSVFYVSTAQQEGRGKIFEASGASWKVVDDPVMNAAVAKVLKIVRSPGNMSRSAKKNAVAKLVKLGKATRAAPPRTASLELPEPWKPLKPAE